MMGLHERITINPAVRFGKPCIHGTRLTVGDVLGYLSSGMTEAELLQDFPQLSHEDVLACLAIGNRGNGATATLLLDHADDIEAFSSHPDAGFLLLSPGPKH